MRKFVWKNVIHFVSVSMCQKFTACWGIKATTGSQNIHQTLDEKHKQIISDKNAVC